MPEGSEKRLLGMLAAVAIAVAFIGFATGTSPGRYTAQRPPPRPAPPASPNIEPARSHAELERNPWGGGPEASGWSRAVEVAAAVATEGEENGGTVEAALVARAARRAYDGAPPTIPHPVKAGGAAECLACHGGDFALAGRRAGGLPHDNFASCTQCHVAAASFTKLPPSAAARAESSFSGLPSPDQGEVAYLGAPPAVPHSTWMRDRCEGCHGPGGANALRTPHPERLSCLQCHPTLGQRQRASR